MAAAAAGYRFCNLQVAAVVLGEPYRGVSVRYRTAATTELCLRREASMNETDTEQ